MAMKPTIGHMICEKIEQSTKLSFPLRFLIRLVRVFEVINLYIPKWKVQTRFRGTIEIPQRTRICNVNCCLNVYNVHLKLLLPISG